MKDLRELDNLIIGRVEPHIYAFTTNTIPNYLKIGDTYRPVSKRLKEWEEYFPNLEKKFEGSARINNDVYFRDYSIHRFLEYEKYRERLSQVDVPQGVYYSKEFFKHATINDIEEAIADIVGAYSNKTGKYQYYDVVTQLPTEEKYASSGVWELRPNQDATVKAFKKAIENGRKHLLMYAVMRFGKSFTSMCCAKEMGAKLVVVVSAKADVKDEWRKTVQSAENFRNDYEFFASSDLERNYNIVTETLNNSSEPKNVVVFLTLQDLQGENIKDKHQQIFGQKIDLLLVDETHFGARAEKYGAVLRNIKGDNERISEEEKYTVEDVLTETKELDVDITIHLSGTPYRILMGDEFDKEKDLIAFYQFTDIVKEQEEWDRDNLAHDEPKEEWENPYYGFPQMIRFAFNPNESTRRRMEILRESGVSDAFSALLAPKSIRKARDYSHKVFVHEQEILELLEVIDGSREDEQLLGFLDYDKIKKGDMCRHIVCVLPYCASCDALEALIKNNISKFKNLNEYEIINISGVDNATRYRNPDEIKETITRFELEGKKTITLTVNRMLTGSTVPEWDTMLFLKDTASPQEYDQAIYRLQNQYVKTILSENGETIKYNMKPQTILVDFAPDRVFTMQEQKAQIYNVNVDESGNTKLCERIEEELRISPIVVMNNDKIERIQASDIIKAVSDYSRNRGVAEETVEIPVDMSLMSIEEIRMAIECENELGSKSGFTTKMADGEGRDMDIQDSLETANADDTEENKSSGNDPSTSEVEDAGNSGKDPAKQFRSYYARILFFAFLTKNIVISLSDIVACFDEPNNARIAKNLGISKAVLMAILNNADKFMISKLDYKIYNLNQLSHDETIDAVTRASVSVQKFGKLGEAEVITPQHICKNMIDLINDEDWKRVVDNGHKVLDIAGKAGEFALAICEKYFELGYDITALENIIYTIPTSGITYEFTRMIYEILGLNINNIATKFTSYSLLQVEDNQGVIDYEKICSMLKQKKAFADINISDELSEEGDEKVNFDVVLGNPPYQLKGASGGTNDAPIYQHFVEVAYKAEASLVSLIIPSKWFTTGREHLLGEFRKKMLGNRSIKNMVSYTDSHDVFPEVAIKGGICYFLHDTKHKGDCLYKLIQNGAENVTNRKLDEFDILIQDPRLESIVKKVACDIHDQSNTVASIISGDTPFGIPTNPKTSNRHSFSIYDTSEDAHNTKLFYLEKSSRKTAFINRDEITKNAQDLDKYKVLLPKAYGAGDGFPHQIIGQPEFASANSVCSQTYLYAAFSTELEARNFIGYLKTKLFRALVLASKTSQDLPSKTYRFIPKQDFSKDWSDEDLYKKYNLSEEEISFIDSMIKPM